MTDTKVSHGSFTIEKQFNTPIESVFAAYVSAEARFRWLIASDGWTVRDYRPIKTAEVGAVEFSSFDLPGSGMVLTNCTVFLDVVPEERVILAYSLALNGAPISSSLLTAEFSQEDKGPTRLVLTEQGAYVDGRIAGREESTRRLMSLFGKEIVGS